MKNYILSIAMCLTGLLSFAQTELVAMEDENGKWGYANPAGNIVITPSYVDAHSFTSGGVALVNQEGKGWKLIDKNNNTIDIPLEKVVFPGFGKFSVWGFRSDMLIVVYKGGQACLNNKGEVLFKDLDDIQLFHDGYSVGKRNNEFYILDDKGNKTKVNADATYVGHLKNGYAPFRNKSLFGLVDSTGEVAIKATFNKTGYFVDGIAWAKTTEKKVGLINTDGKWVVQPEFTYLSKPDSIHHICEARKGKQLMYLRVDGTTFEIPGATGLNEFHEGVAWVKTENGVGVIDENGKWIVQPEYEVIENASNGMLSVRKNNLWGAIDLKGNVIVEPQYKRLEERCEGRIAVNKNDLWGYIDYEGNVVIEPQFQGAHNFQNGYAAVKVGNNWGLIDPDGTFTIEAKYHRIKDVEVF